MKWSYKVVMTPYSDGDYCVNWGEKEFNGPKLRSHCGQPEVQCSDEVANQIIAIPLLLAACRRYIKWQDELNAERRPPLPLCDCGKCTLCQMREAVAVADEEAKEKSGE